ncbi:MAG: thioredoxin family protein [Bacteroidia bacterium]
MKNLIYIAFSAIVMIAAYAFENPQVDFKADTKEGIQFHKGTWDEALQLAKKENKLIFLDIYATWCGPCKKLKAKTFSNAEVGKFYNQNFVNVAFDGEQGDGAMLMQKYNLQSFPSLLFIDGNGKVIAKTVGYHNPDELIELGQQLLKN